MDKAYKTPLASSSRLPPSTLRTSTATKRTSLAAELERDPQLSTVKRKQRTQAFTSQMAQASLERQLLAAQTTKTELEQKLREKDAAIERLENDRRFLAEREQEEREEKERERLEREEEKRKADSDIRALRNSYMALREEHADLEDAHTELARSTSQTIANQQSELATLSTQLKLVQDELANLKVTSEEQSQAFEELQRQYDELSAVQDVSRATLVDDDNWSVVREELHRQADYLRTVEAENARMHSEMGILTQRHENVEVLKEQKRELERKVRDVDSLHEKIARLEGELTAARRERQEWAKKTTDPSHTPISVTQNLSSLRLTHARLLEEHGASKALLRRREHELADAEQATKEAQEAIAKLQEERDSLRDKAVRNEHRADLAEREVNFLKAMVASFTAEEASQDGVKVEELTSQRVQHLESLVSDYQTTIAHMEKKLEDLGGDPSTIAGVLPRQELLDDLEAEKNAKVAALQCQFVFLFSGLRLTLDSFAIISPEGGTGGDRKTPGKDRRARADPL
ncbi:hypothetical protein NM688_g2917 [Phlebia brevispora]|uniref:Uncharacterized protein n=1 Tax=Phlebia brevispora TaxID=194682 RepID=A0ACC1T7A5_9APHY|nr:hypothetical protein NM688_g2917 [Phlebia brevispora]